MGLRETLGFDPIETRALRPSRRQSYPTDPNSNPPGVPPASVGVPDYRPGDPNGIEFIDEGSPPPRSPPPRAAPWSGWPAEWSTPGYAQLNGLVDTAWMCLDLNSRVIATMPPYRLTGGKLNTLPRWVENPDPDLYTSWNEFAKQLWWDYQMGEAFIICTARYADGYPARFHVLEPWLVNVEMGADGRRKYNIGSVDPGPDLLHIRYKSTTSSAHGVGPLDAGASRVVAAGLLQRYASRVIESGGVPYYVIKHPDELTASQISDLQGQWYESRMNSLGMPAIMSGGIEIEQLQMNPADMALVELSQYTDSRIAVLLGVPPFLVGLPAGGDSMTYSNVSSLFTYHWTAGLSTFVDDVCKALSYWLLPASNTLELNRDMYIRPGQLERAQYYEILIRNGVLTPEDVMQLERFAIVGSGSTPEVALV